MPKYDTKFLNALFNYLSERNIPYCVVVDSSSLPDDIPSDIDIVISCEDFLSIKEKIHHFSQTQQCDVLQILQHEQTALCFVLPFLNNCGRVEYITSDICSDFFQQGIRLIFSVDLLAGRKLARSERGEEKSFYIPAPDIEFIYYLIKKTGKGTIDQQQYYHLRDQYLSSPEKCTSRMLKYWPWAARKMSWLIPEPDLFIVLDAPAEVIQARKQEVPIGETNRQREAYLGFAKAQANCIVLSTSGELEETVNEGCSAVLDYTQKREEARLGLK